jgi:hypothetical protein
VAVALKLAKKVDGDLLRQHQQRKKNKCDSFVDKACGLLKAVNKIGNKIVASPYFENLW